jgi:hypothetical protein
LFLDRDPRLLDSSPTFSIGTRRVAHSRVVSIAACRVASVAARRVASVAARRVASVAARVATAPVGLPTASRVGVQFEGHFGLFSLHYQRVSFSEHPEAQRPRNARVASVATRVATAPVGSPTAFLRLRDHPPL